jgi:excinuclease ABC subunit C
MNTELIKTIPKLPGIYIFKDKEGTVIYVGKAKCLQERVSSYFRRQSTDWKVLQLIKEHALIEHIITQSETEALLLEAQLIRTFKPKYNVLLKSGNPFIYILITNQELPKLKLTPTKREKGIYFGPFLNKHKVRAVFEYLIRTFQLSCCSNTIASGCLDYHLGRCAGNCLPTFNQQDYIVRLTVARRLLEGNYEACEALLKEQIRMHNAQLEFEKSKHITEYLKNLAMIFQTLKTGFSETKYTKNINALTTPIEYKIKHPSQALEALQLLLKLKIKPISIDCFDISHFQGSYLVGSCVRFTNGIPDTNNVRRFKIKTLNQQNDYAALQEIVKRRYKNLNNLPDVMLIDGGKGQLNAVKDFFPQVPCMSLAKREETLYTQTTPQGITLDIQTPLGQLLIALRDYAHHFAVSYHKSLRSRSFTTPN